MMLRCDQIYIYIYIGSQELGAMGKKLRLSKSHAESLSRALNDQSRHALGGGGHPTGAAPPPLPPPPQQLIDAKAHDHMLY